MKPGHTVVLVEFSNGRLFSVVTMNIEGHYDHYDFVWCKRDKTFLWHRSGGSFYMEWGQNDYWLVKWHKKPKDGGGKKVTGERLKKMPKKYPLDDLFIGTNGVNDEAEFCGKCKDWLPSGDPCQHQERSN